MIVRRAGKNLQGQRFTRTEQHISITARFALNTDLLKYVEKKRPLQL